MGRRRRVAEVPDLNGLSVPDAENAVLDAGLLPRRVSQGSDLSCAGRQDGALVCGQDPRPHARMVAVGRFFFVLIHVVVEESFGARPVSELDGIRRQVEQALREVHPRVVLDVIFTADEYWATAGGPDDGGGGERNSLAGQGRPAGEG